MTNIEILENQIADLDYDSIERMVYRIRSSYFGKKNLNQSFRRVLIAKIVNRGWG